MLLDSSSELPSPLICQGVVHESRGVNCRGVNDQDNNTRRPCPSTSAESAAQFVITNSWQSSGFASSYYQDQLISVCIVGRLSTSTRQIREVEGFLLSIDTIILEGRPPNDNTKTSVVVARRRRVRQQPQANAGTNVRGLVGLWLTKPPAWIW